MNRILKKINFYSALFCICATQNYSDVFADDPSSTKQKSYTLGTKTCQTLFSSVIPAYKSLYQKLEPRFKQKQQKSVDYLLQAKPEDCKAKEKRLLIEKALATHKSKIGILLPNSSKADISYINYMIGGIKKYIKNQKDIPTVVYKNTKGTQNTFHQKLAELVFDQEVSLIIGGADPQEGELLERWAERLKIPIIILRDKAKNLKARNNLFYISPNSKNMAQDIISFIMQKNLPSIAILHPTNHSSKLIKAIEEAAAQAKLPEIQRFHYMPDSYQSQEKALKKLFQIDRKKRAEELAQKIEKLKEASENPSSIEIDSEQVYLDPIVDVDAIMIFDNFKNTRYLIKTFKYLRVPKIPILGLQQWRAEELLHPAEPYLEGSYFFDYIGSYEKLPFNLGSTSTNPWFVDVKQAESLDLQLIAMHALDVGVRALKETNLPRYLLFQNLKELPQKDKNNFFFSKFVFNDQHVSHWPTFAFQLKADMIQSVQPIRRPKDWKSYCTKSVICRKKIKSALTTAKTKNENNQKAQKPQDDVKKTSTDPLQGSE